MDSDAAKRAKIVERVRLLLAMTKANGCTEAEAMSAAAKAADLMKEYDVAFRDVKAIGDERVLRDAKPFGATGRPREMHAAGIYAAVAVGEFFDCKCWRDQTEIVFFGLRDDVGLAHVMLAMIRFAMDRELDVFLASEAGRGENTRAVAASFLRGMGHRVSERLNWLKADRNAHRHSHGRDLVVVKAALVDAEFAKRWGTVGLRKGRPARPHTSQAAYAAGYAAAERVNLVNKEIKHTPAPNNARMDVGERRRAKRSPVSFPAAAEASRVAGRERWGAWLARYLRLVPWVRRHLHLR